MIRERLQIYMIFFEETAKALAYFYISRENKTKTAHHTYNWLTTYFRSTV